MQKKKDFYQIALKTLLRNKKREVLALKALDNGSMAGYYDLPGGRIAPDEFLIEFEEILTREMKEEIGNIQLDLHRKPVAIGRHFIPASMAEAENDIHVLYLFFEAEYLSGDIAISNEHLEYKWLNLREIELTKYFTSGILEGIEMYLGR